ncbi:MAG: putative potassium channel protein [Cyanobacteria bacterium RYN_339]|nr:putative potassium channel protein [Cyanobacteria bacterium RYN_339]
MNDERFGPKRYFDLAINALILVSVALLGLEFLWWTDEVLPPWMIRLDDAILGVFLAEYVVRLWVIEPELPEAIAITGRQRLFYALAARLSWAIRPINLVDLAAILPIFPFFRSLRVLRLLRLAARLRVVRRLFRYFNPFAAAEATLRDNQLLFLFVTGFIGITIAFASATVFIAEHPHNPAFAKPFDAVYWAVVTITTVGYGDKAPITTGGRVIAMALMLTGFFIFALLAGAVSQTFVQTLLHFKKEGIRMTAMVNHIVVCGWDSQTLMLLHELREQGEEVAARVVVFANRERPEALPEWVTFVSGDPTQETELPKVRLEACTSVVVVADERGGMAFSDADARTLLTVFTLRSFEAKLGARGIQRTKPIHVTAELLDPDNFAFLKAAGVDQIIQTARIGAALLARSAANPQGGVPDLLGEMALPKDRSFWET